MMMKNIIENLQYIDQERIRYRKEYYEIQLEKEYLERAIAQAGLTDHIKEIIKNLKDTDEVPF